MAAPSRGVVAIAVPLLLLAAACGTDEPEATTSSSPTSTGTTDPLDDPTQQALLAKITAGTPPADLSWRYTDPPASWRRIGTQESQGTTQWQVGRTRCGVSLSQPSGVGSAESPTSDEVADKAVTDLAATVPGAQEPDVLERGDRMLPNRVVGLDAASTAKVATRTVSLGSGIEGYFLGYRDGDFALQLSAVCGQDAYASKKAEIEAFVAGLSAVTRY